MSFREKQSILSFFLPFGKGKIPFFTFGKGKERLKCLAFGIYLFFFFFFCFSGKGNLALEIPQLTKHSKYCLHIILPE